MTQTVTVHDIFDADFYSRLYGVERQDAIKHFLENGLLEKANPHPLFDSAWYLLQRPDVAAAGMNPLEHYIRYGAFERVDPHPIFDTRWYLERHPDVAAMGLNPLLHYIYYGASELWDTHPLFDTRWYVNKYPEVSKSQQNPLIHYLLYGAAKGYNPHPLFDTNWYYLQRPDVAASGGNPLAHYITSGQHEGTDPHPIFKTTWYLQVHKDVAEAGQNPLIHYLQYGAAEGWDPHPLFNTEWYLATQFNVAVSGQNPLIHFLERGAREGRSPHPLFDTNWYYNQRPDIAAADINPLAHYIQSGSDECTDPHPWFDTRYYRAHSQFLNRHKNPLMHYLEQGWANGISPHPLFDAGYYNKTNPDVEAVGADPFLHWITMGRAEGRNPTPLFDHEYYLVKYPDVAAAGIPALDHFMSSGHLELRNPHPLFDTAWYNKNVLNGNEEKINPLKHFAQFGAFYELDPSPRFSTSKYLDANPTLRHEKVNALAHYTTWGKKLAKEKYLSDHGGNMSAQYFAANDISAGTMMGLIEADLEPVLRHFFYKPLNIDVSPHYSTRPRLHILMPGLNRRYATGGPNTAYILGCLLAKVGIPVTFASVDVPPDQDIRPLIEHLENLTQLDIGALNIQFADASDRLNPYFIGSGDVFMATAWWTAQAAKSAAALTKNARFYYLIQDLESTFYGGSVLQAVSKETYSFNHLPIINTSLLRDQLAYDKIGNYMNEGFVEKAVVFEPAVDRSYFYPVSGKQSGSRRLLFYARPTMAERNLFGLGVASLKALASNGVFDGEEWEFIGMGEDFEPIPLGHGNVLRPAPWLDFAGYAELMRSADVLLSLMFSPHPSYPPLEMAICGNPVVTTSYGVKSSARLNLLSRNIIAVEPNIENIVFGLTRALTMRERDKTSDAIDPSMLPRSWTESLSAIIPRLLEELKVDGIVPNPLTTPPRQNSDHRDSRLPTELGLQIKRRRTSFRTADTTQKLGILIDDNAKSEYVESLISQFSSQRVSIELNTDTEGKRIISNDVEESPHWGKLFILGFSHFVNKIKNHDVAYEVRYVTLSCSNSMFLSDAYDIMQTSIERMGNPPIIKFDDALPDSERKGLSVYLVRTDVVRNLITEHRPEDLPSFLRQIGSEWEKTKSRGIVNEVLAINWHSQSA